MKRIALFFLLITSLLAFGSFKPGKKDKRTKVLIHTEYGDIKIVLYDETPKHRDNFIKLVKEGTIDGTLFHRVIPEFMIQGGDPDSKKAKPGEMLGNGDVGYTIPAEIMPNLFHKRGALAAARQGDDVNPKKESSGCQFYIVQGRVFNDTTLNEALERIYMPMKQQIFMEYINDPKNAKTKDAFIRNQQRQNGDSLQILSRIVNPKIDSVFKTRPHREVTEEQRQAYKTIGGTPHLDGGYTVFGEVISGLDVVEKISKEACDKMNRPLKDIKMTVTFVKK
jgi:peptidylprolyl isomerase